VATVLISGIVDRIDGTPWSGAMIIFDLLTGSYSAQALQPKGRLPVTCDNAGAFTVPLWCNEEGLIEDQYSCTMPDGRSFKFSIPKGISTATISFLRTLTNSSTPIDASAATAIFAYLDSALLAAGDTRETLTVTVPGQTQFMLVQTPARPDLSKIYYLDCVFLPQDSYVINVRSLTWIRPIALEVGEVLDIYYQVQK
jgi:hypothetical protein